MHSSMKLNPKMFTAQVDLEDFLQLANIGVISAMNLYDVNHPKKANFNTFAHWYIRKEINLYLRKHG